MRGGARGSIVLGFLLLMACATGPGEGSGGADAEIRANDNRTPAGHPASGALSLNLEIREGLWQPEHDLAPYRVLAFAEAGGPLVTPGPLIRVREGMRVDVTLKNLLDADIFVHALSTRAPDAEPVRVPAHGEAAAHFTATTAGTYYYWGSLEKAPATREDRDSQLTGALIVDPREGGGNDRVFVVGRLGGDEDGVHVGSGLGAWVINGRSWPDTERLSYEVGEAISWRWINGTGHWHPMHLHGTYFRVQSAGDNAYDTPVPADRQQSVVTQVLTPGATMAIAWSPERPGNWLFHCHNLFHVMPENRLHVPMWFDEYADLPHDQHMAGLVLGIHAVAKHADATEPPASDIRHMTLHVGERRGKHYKSLGLEGPGLGYSIDDGPIAAPGPIIALERDRPAEITIVNEIAHATAVHWHGIELESYYDGVPHWGGDAAHVTPDIEPGRRFVARFVPPRAGTFIYHTHFNDYVQLTSGLYGALIITEPGHPLSPDVDHAFVIGQDGFDDAHDPLLLNGAASPAPMMLLAGTHRVRLIGMTASESVRIRLTHEGTLLAWTPRARDGADLPDSLRIARPAEVEVFPGQTFDFDVVAADPGELRLEGVMQNDTQQRASAALIVRR